MDRKSIFVSNLNEIINHNADESQTYKKGVNAFTDMTFDEFKKFYRLEADQNCSATRDKKAIKAEVNLKETPSLWDWRDFNGVTPVKD